MADFVAALKKDLVEQFKGKANIEALMEIIGEELQQVYKFYEQLRENRSVQSAVGKQLDGVGDIVVLSRMEAGILAGNPIPFEVIGDDKYRQYLIFKILKNTCSCTYPDIIKAFRMFWDRPLYYREDPEQPATMIFDTGEITADTDTSRLLSAPIIRAAGVGVKLVITIVCEIAPMLHIGGFLGAVTRMGLLNAPDALKPQAPQPLHAGGVFCASQTLSAMEDRAPPPSVTILRTGGVCTIISNP